MSARYIAHVTTPDGSVAGIDCDRAHVDEHGYLRLSVAAGDGFDTRACFRREAWLHYELLTPPAAEENGEALPEADTPAEFGKDPRSDWLRRGTWSIDRARAEISSPEAGDIVHVWPGTEASTCIRMRVIDKLQTAVDGRRLLLEDPADTSGQRYRQAFTHDESRQTPNSWHWPCDGDKEPAELEPDVPAPTVVVNLTVNGSVLSENDLLDAMQKQLTRLGMRNSTAWPYHGRR